MNLLDHVLVQKGALGRRELKLLAAYVAQAEKVDSLVSNFGDETDNGEVEWVVNKTIRDTQEVQLTDEVNALLNGIVKASVEDRIDSFYGVTVGDWEPPHILHYGVAGHYSAHVDAETLYKDELGRDYWEKTLDRDLSVVYFLNHDFDGGELDFSELDFRIKPQAGTLVCFPSDHNYIHGIRPVNSGHRYSIVTWLRVKGTPTPEEINRKTFAAYRRVSPKPFSQPPRLRRRK